MAATFIVGRAGTGKTMRTLQRIEELIAVNPLGKPIWLIVPRQATFQTQRELLVRLGSYGRVRVVGFDDLGDEVLQEVGGVPLANVTAAGRRMIIGRLLYAHHDQLQYFASSARRPGLAAAIDELFDEFERSGRSLDEIAGLLNDAANRQNSNLPVEGLSLHAKLADLQLLYRAYSEFVGQGRVDPNRRRLEIQKKIALSTLLEGSTVFVDGFFEFTANERQMLVRIAAIAADIEINLTFDANSPVLAGGHPELMSPFYRTETNYVRLVGELAEGLVPINETVRLSDVKRFVSSELAAIEWRFAGQPASAAPSVSAGDDREPVVFMVAPDRRVEVQAIARRIRDLLRDGYRQREIVVLARSLDDYLHLIHAAFDEHGLTYFADRRRSATHHPLVRLIRSLLRIARNGWETAPVLAMIKSGLAGLSVAEADELENYLRAHGLGAANWLQREAWQFAEHRVEADEEFLEEEPQASDVPPPPAGHRPPDKARRWLVEQVHPLSLKLHRRAVSLPLRQLAVELMQTLERMGVRKTMADWITSNREGHIEQSDEHQQVWTQFTELLNEMVDVLGDQVVEAGEFVEIVESGLDGFDLAITPPTVDQVLVGTVDRTRVLFPRAVFVLGLSRGVFPSTHHDDSILSGPERRELQQQRVDVQPDSQRRQLNERHLAYFALTRASHRLFLSRPSADDSGREYDASEFWAAARQAVPHRQVYREEPCTGNTASCISTPRDLISSLLDWARSELDGSTKPADQSNWRWPLYNWLANGPAARGELHRLVDLAWPALCYSNEAKLSKELAASLFASPLVASASQLESFASCPFQHFVTYGLKLSMPVGGDITPMDLSRIYHDTLHGLLEYVIASRKSIGAVPASELARLADEYSRDVANRIRGELWMDEARSVYLVARVKRALELIIGTLREQLARGSFRPVRTDVSFGPGRRLASPELPLASGGSLRLRGRIDRLDSRPDGAVAMYDYRLGEKKLVPSDVLYGLDLRLLACLLVLERAKNDANAKKLMPVAAFCARLRRSIGSVHHPSDASAPDTPEFLLSAKPRGVVIDTEIPAFDKELTTGTSKVLAVRVNSDGQIGDRERSDAATADEFETLVDFVAAKVSQLADGIVTGRIAVEPYLYRDTSPCVRCDYRKFCRFEQVVNRYRLFAPLKRAEAMDQMRKQVDAGTSAKGERNGR